MHFLFSAVNENADKMKFLSRPKTKSPVPISQNVVMVQLQT